MIDLNKFVGLIFIWIFACPVKHVHCDLQNVAFDSTDSGYRQMMPRLFKIEKVGEATHISVTLQQNGPKSPIEHIESDLYWYVNNMPISPSSRRYFSRTQSYRWSADSMSITYTLGTTLPTNKLRSKRFNLKIRYYQQDFVPFVQTNQQQNRSCYTYFNYDIKLNGADIPFPELSHSPFPLYVFEHLDYYVKKTNDVRNYEARFNFSPHSSPPFIVNDIVVTFEGGQVLDMQNSYPYLFSTDHLNRHWSQMRGDFIYVRDICTVSTCKTSKEEKVSISIDPLSSTHFHGMFKISVSTTNIFNIKVSLTFDLTSYLYECLATGTNNAFIPITGLKITEFYSTIEEDEVALLCRVFGDEHIQIDFFRKGTSGERVEITENKYTQRGKHETLGSLVLRPEDRRGGTYVCVAMLSRAVDQTASVESSLDLNFG